MKMKKILIAFAVMAAFVPEAIAQKKYKDIKPDTASVRYIRNPKPEDSYILEGNMRKNTIFVNEEVTTHAGEHQAGRYFHGKDCRQPVC